MKRLDTIHQTLKQYKQEHINNGGSGAKPKDNNNNPNSIDYDNNNNYPDIDESHPPLPPNT